MAQIPEYLLPEETIVGTQVPIIAQPIMPIEPVTANPLKKYQDVYSQIYEQQRMNNPGQPEEMIRQTALTVAEKARIADENAEDFKKASEANKIKSIEAENQRRSSLGLPIIPISMPAQAVQPMESNIVPASDAPVNVQQNQPMIPQMPQAPSMYSGDKAIQESYLAQQKALDEQAKAADTYKLQQQDLMKQGLDKIKAAEDELGKYEIKNYWADRSTGAKIGAAIAMALGGFGAGISGGRNQAADIINSAIDRDLQIQKEKQARLQGKLSSARTLLGDQQKMLGDTYAAELNVKNIGLQKARLIADEALAKTNNQAKKLELQKLSAELGQVQAATQANLLKRMAFVQAAEGGQINPMMLDKEDQARFVPDDKFGGLALDPEAAKVIRAKLPSYKASKDNIKVLTEILKKPGSSLSPSDRETAEKAVLSLRASLRPEILGPGAVTDFEQEILKAIAKSPTAVFQLPAATLKGYEFLNKRLDKTMYDTAKAYMATPIKFNPAMNDSVMIKVPGSKQGVRVPRADLPRYQQKYKNLEVVGE